MLEAKKYTVSEIKRILSESSDFKPKVGKNVWKDNSQNNVKAVDDILKQTKDYNNVEEKKRDTNPEKIVDCNKTTLDVNFTYEPSKDYKDRVKVQVEGFPSVANQKDTKIKDNDSLDFEGNKDFYSKNAKKQKEVSDKKAEETHAGLKSHNLPKSNYKDKTIFTNEDKKMKRLQYSGIFLNESQVLKKIPDSYKVDGNRFMVKDKSGMEYIIECVKDGTIEYVHTNIVKVNKPQTMVNEEFEKMKHLYGYKSNEYFAESTIASRKKEDKALSENLNKVKKLMVEQEHKKK